MLSFPFWMARLADRAATSGLQPLAFSSPRRLSAYLTAQDVEHWQLHLVTRYSAVTYLTELQLLGHTTLGVNVNEDGTGGTKIQINDLLDELAKNS
jgi:hypothetical protein